MQDNITVSRELLRQVLRGLRMCDQQNQVLDDTYTALRAALEQPAPVQEPMFWVRLRSDGMYEGPIHNAQIEKVRKESGGWTPLYTAPQAQQPDRIAQLEAANTNLFEQGQKMHKRIQELEAAPVQEPVCRGCGIPINDIHMSTCPTKKWPMYVTPADAAQPEPVQEQQFTADELDLMRQWFESMQDTNRSFVIDADKKLHQKIIAAIQAAPRAEQPRKAVKLSDSEILTALDVEYVSSAQNRELFLSDARTIEAAVWAKLGVSE